MDEVRDSMALKPHGGLGILVGGQPFLDGRRSGGLGVWMAWLFWLWAERVCGELGDLGNIMHLMQLSVRYSPRFCPRVACGESADIFSGVPNVSYISALLGSTFNSTFQMASYIWHTPDPTQKDAHCVLERLVASVPSLFAIQCHKDNRLNRNDSFAYQDLVSDTTW